MDKVISRRDFIVGGGVFGASMAAVGLAGCAPSNAGLPSTDTDASGTSTHTLTAILQNFEETKI